MRQSPMVKRKVLAYITREQGGHKELLVFTHRDYPEAGLQVPGGTVEDTELLIDALYREVEEETGLKRDDLQLQGKLHKYMYYAEDREKYYERNFFHLEVTAETSDEWEYVVDGDGEDGGLHYQFQWTPVKECALAADQDNAVEWLYQ
ncbi:NUDIX domain-containing protein [Jeotgalibacillus sp. ET6]|uniref:NUDIX hydrolase n=1 Tax=Jeotgalibacillus sp. ET6 TaxID=3037260 RepID=UPI00241880B4|nr:NUDIX domain-containing protein [Jeotgalibacillus sp. ET6]MDG5473617.1 NUDIX domain-containing protein [Jeotgalibacillus sp. ET6]